MISNVYLVDILLAFGDAGVNGFYAGFLQNHNRPSNVASRPTPVSAYRFGSGEGICGSVKHRAGKGKALLPLARIYDSCLYFLVAPKYKSMLTVSDTCLEQRLFFGQVQARLPIPMAKKLEQKIENDTLTKALTLIDPSGTLVPGTEEHDSIKDMIRGWIDECGPDHALAMARKGAEHLGSWLKCR